MKFCFKCKTDKDELEFHRNKNHKDGLSSYCKICAGKEANKYNQNNKQKVRDCTKQQKKKLSDIVNKIKEKYGCCFCGEKCFICLSFHHINNKEKDVSRMIITKNKQRVFDEINKCIVVCENCHRKIHYGILNSEGKTRCNECIEDYFIRSYSRLYYK